MKLGDTIPPEEWVARAVIFPTHLPAQQLSQESLLNFQSDTDPAVLNGWAHAYVMSVSCMSMCNSDDVHRSGRELADVQNRERPLSQTDESAPYGHKRHYLGYYAFQTAEAVQSADKQDETVTLFWPENEFPAHGNCCIRLSGDLSKRDRTARRVRIIALIWRALTGPTRFLYDAAHPFAEAVNSLPLDPMPKG